MASLGMSGGQASEEALALTLRGQREAMQRGLLLQPSGPGCYLPVAAIGFGSRGQASAPALLRLPGRQRPASLTNRKW